MEDSVKERIKMFLKYLSIGQNAFEMKVGWSNGYINNTKNISADKLLSVIKEYPQLNISWLITGEGEMLKSDNSVKIFVPEDLPKQVGRLYRAPIYESYPVSAGLHGLAEIRDDKPDGYAYTTMPGVTFFPVIGCSFEPIIYAGEYIGVVKLNSWDRVDTEKIYFILTKEERMLKRLRVDKDREDILWCVSPNFSEFSILKSDIVEINHVFFYGKMI
jgi:hypothetical protein